MLTPAAFPLSLRLGKALKMLLPVLAGLHEGWDDDNGSSNAGGWSSTLPRPPGAGKRRRNPLPIAAAAATVTVLAEPNPNAGLSEQKGVTLKLPPVQQGKQQW